jgi:SWIM zinc finger
VSDQPYDWHPICILAGDRKQFEDYVLSRGSKLGIHNKDYVDGTSSNCAGIHFSRVIEIGTFHQRKDAEVLRSICLAHTLSNGGYLKYNTPSALTFDPEKDSIPIMNLKNGEIRKLPKANSPMWAEQWAYQGTAKAPYIVSAKKKSGNGMTSGWDQVWGCSCPDWTKHSPRVDCKHILAVKLKEKIATNLAPIIGANMSPEIKKDFEKFLAQKAANVVKSGKSPLEDKGRKFRTE